MKITDLLIVGGIAVLAWYIFSKTNILNQITGTPTSSGFIPLGDGGYTGEGGQGSTGGGGQTGGGGTGSLISPTGQFLAAPRTYGAVAQTTGVIGLPPLPRLVPPGATISKYALAPTGIINITRELMALKKVKR
jgi:hypothetical protein